MEDHFTCCTSRFWIVRSVRIDMMGNSVGQSQSGAYGLQVIGTASFCAGARFNGIALRASVAIGCTTFGGIVDPATTKFLMTP